MKEFIDNLGYGNFVIIITIIIIILILLILVFLLEKFSMRKSYKKALDEYKTQEDGLQEDKKEKITYEDQTKNHIKADPIQSTTEFFEKTSSESALVPDTNVKTSSMDVAKLEFKAPTRVEIVKKEDPIAYDEHVSTKEEAKEKLNEVTKKLVEEKKQDLSGPTHFEKEQEEMSIISYDELKNISYNIDETNDQLLDDEGDEPITIEELYKKHLEKQDEENLDNTRKIDNPIFEETIHDAKKFKNSAVISPVYGIYNAELKNTNYTKDDFDKTFELDELETEIRKTEEFLKELKNLKNKLD